MKLMVIEGGKSVGIQAPTAVLPLMDDCGEVAVPSGLPLPPTVADIQAEAGRRSRLGGYDSWSLRSFATGAPIPRPLRYQQMQIAFIAEALTRLDPIPDDFRSDIYWPSA